MNKKDRRRLLHRLQAIASQASTVDRASTDPARFWSTPTEAIVLREDALRDFADLISSLAQSEPWKRRASEYFIENRLMPILGELRRDSGSAEQMLAELVNEVESYSIERTVYVPIGGLYLEGVDDITIGRVQIFQMDDDRLQELLRFHESLYEDIAEVEGRKERLRYHQDEFREKLLHKVCAVVKVAAEPDRAMELAELETRRALEVLMFGYSTAYFNYGDSEAVAGLLEELPDGSSWTLSMSSDTTITRVRTLPRSLPIRIGPHSLEQLDDVGVFVLSDWLRKSGSELTKIEDALLRAVHWFAAAQSQMVLENKLLNLMTCLEALLGSDRGVPISNTIAESAAFIMVDQPEERRRAKKYIKDAYNLRSKISHGDDKPVTEGLVKTLRWICGTLISKLIEWSPAIATKQALDNWLEEVKFSGAVDEPHEALRQQQSLRSHREAIGLTLQELADRSGRDLTAIEHWEQSGGLRNLEAILRFADVFGLAPDDLVQNPVDRLISVFGHRFLLTSRRLGPGKWEASTVGWDPSEATHIPESVIPAPGTPGPGTFSTFWIGGWYARGFSARDALDAMERWIVNSAHEDLRRLEGAQELKSDRQ